jgi:hypothetical protein
MSLINDALKKAQRERTSPAGHPASIGTPPAGHAPGGAPHAPPPQRSNPWLPVLVVVAVIGGGTAVWFLKPGGAPAPVAVASNIQTSTTNSGAAEPAPAGPTEPVENSGPVQLQINLPGSGAPAAAPVATNPAPVAVAPTPAPAAPVVAAQPTPPPTAPTSPSSEPLKITLQLEDPRILAFLDAARINGVRSVADDAKLLMNNKVFRAGGVVDRELGLKLVQILPNELVFEDSRGIQYRKLL